jgi:hypothetical protein
LRAWLSVTGIFSAWLVQALLLLGLGRLTTAGDGKPAPERAGATR